MSETAKNRQHTLPYLKGNGIDIGCGSDPVTDQCIGIDLPRAAFTHYNGLSENNARLHAFADDLPFKDHVLDFVYSSHLLEDFAAEEWPRLLREWVRVLKPGGTLVILIPEVNLWRAAVAAGQPPNDAHRHEGTVGELSALAPLVGVEPIRDEQIGDYSILFVGKKL